MDTLENAELATSIRHINQIFKIRNTDLQFRSRQVEKQRKKKKNTGNCKALCVLRKRSKTKKRKKTGTCKAFYVLWKRNKCQLTKQS